MGDDLAEILEYLPDREEEALAQPRFRTEEFCTRFLRRIDEIRLFDPQAALAPASLAIRLAAMLPNPFFGQAWATWASVQRALANYDQAEVGHRVASLYLEDPVDLARFFRRQAYLLRDQGKFGAARKRIGRALAMYLASGDSHSRGCALADLATVHLAEKNYGEAALRNTEALRHIDPERDPAYHESAVHNLAVALSLCDQPGARLEVLLKEIRQRRYTQGSLPWAKHRWLEGLVFKRRHRYRRAEVTLRAARNLFVKLGAVHDAGLVTMDMAELYLSAGDWEKSARLAREMFPVFKSLGIEREAVAAFRLYVKAAVGRTLTEVQIQKLRSLLLQLARVGTAHP